MVMKILTLFLILFALLLLGIIFIGTSEMHDITRTQQRELDYLRRVNKEQKDSLQASLTKTRDSLKVALHTIEVKHQETVRADEASKSEIRKLKSILFVRYESDSARVKALKELYKSFKTN